MSLKINKELLKFVLNSQDPVTPTPAGDPDPKTPTGPSHFSIYQVPNRDNDSPNTKEHPTIPQFGGLQVDLSVERFNGQEVQPLYVNEEVVGNGRGYDIKTIETIGKKTEDNDLEITSTNPGNGGIVLVNKDEHMVVIVIAV